MDRLIRPISMLSFNILIRSMAHLSAWSFSASLSLLCSGSSLAITSGSYERATQRMKTPRRARRATSWIVAYHSLRPGRLTRKTARRAISSPTRELCSFMRSKTMTWSWKKYRKGKRRLSKPEPNWTKAVFGSLEVYGVACYTLPSPINTLVSLSECHANRKECCVRET